ncbi:MAG: hypothetical protein JSW28_07675 [Thermoplasmata archaeon]|nr:MAG: hypothetical protein JSW28_07675 [Thermoplasmata archaeon]
MTFGTKLKIIGQSLGEVEAEIIDRNPKTSEAVLKALPFEGAVNTWGEEVYFDIPVNAKEEDAQQVMEEGDIAFWPLGSAMCIFFGPTPASEDERPKAYTPVNLFARVIGDAKVFGKLKDGEIIQVLRAEE